MSMAGTVRGISVDMAQRTRPPFRADHVGSLLRPDRLHAARADFKAGRLDAEGLRAVEDDAVRDAIALQRDAGLRSVTDGEQRRTSWHMDFIYSLGGFTQVAGESLHVRFHDEQGTYDYAPPAMKVAGKVTLRETIFAEAFAFLRDNASPEQTPKLTIPSPSMVHYRGGNSSIDPAAYPDADEFWTDLAAAYNAQMRGVYELGCRYLQLDDTSLAYVNDPAQREHIEAIGGDPAHLHERYIANINRALAGRPEDLTITTHLCRGNNQSMWAAEGGYDFVAEALFNDLEVDGYFLEYDDERSGTFEPLRFVPRGKLVVLGLVTTKRPALEAKDALKRRIEEASKYVDVDQLCLSPQCGFSSTEEGNRLSIADQAAKLRLIVETAEEVWG
jgi:5-methyltetrahydropteroyltriglutamate--homocysteine methyltransferase